MCAWELLQGMAQDQNCEQYYSLNTEKITSGYKYIYRDTYIHLYTETQTHRCNMCCVCNKNVSLQLSVFLAFMNQTLIPWNNLHFHTDLSGALVDVVLWLYWYLLQITGWEKAV